MKLSKHANTRSQQRSIPHELIRLICEQGTPEARRGGAIAYVLRSRDRTRIEHKVKRQLQLLDKAMGVEVIVKDDTVLTAYRPSA